MDTFQRVAVALARAESDTSLLRYARRLAQIWPESEFSFVHVLSWARPGQDPDTVVGHDLARREIEDAVARDFGRPANCRILTGSRFDRLLEFTAEQAPGLLLAGHRKASRGRRSLVRRLAMQAPCSVLLVPEGSAPLVQAIAAAIDFSENAAAATAIAARFAARAGAADLIVLHAIPSGAPDPDPAAYSRFLAPVDLHGLETRRIDIRAASVSDAVGRLAESLRIDLVVMGARGQSRSESVLLGEESEQMLIESARPVLVTKPRGERLALLQTLLDRDFGSPPARAAR